MDDDDDVRFKAEGRLYFIAIDDEDPQFFRLVFPNFWSIEDADERQKVLVAASHATMKTKVSKVFVVRDNVWASVELFVGQPVGVQPVFKRSLSALQAGVRAFAESMREQGLGEGQRRNDRSRSRFRPSIHPRVRPGGEQLLEVRVDGNAIWNNRVYISWQNITHVYQPDSRNLVIDTWKVDDNGDGDPRNDKNRIVQNHPEDCANGILVSMGRLKGGNSGATAVTRRNSDGSATVTLSATASDGTVDATYTIRPNDPNVYASLELSPLVDTGFWWGVYQIGGVWVRDGLGGLEKYDQVIVDGMAHPTDEDLSRKTYHWESTTAEPDWAAIISTANEWATGVVLTETPIPLEFRADLIWYQYNYGHHIAVSTADDQKLDAGREYTFSAIFRADQDVTLRSFKEITGRSRHTRSQVPGMPTSKA